MAKALAAVKRLLSMSLPKATAVWLIDQTALTFNQIAEFCGISHHEVQAIADGELAQGMIGCDPVANMQVTADDISRCEADPDLPLERLEPGVGLISR
jgi:hypothetical protein